jgi:hypothetical protein
MNLFMVRPMLRLNMTLFEAKYRNDTGDSKPLSRQDVIEMRAYVVGALRRELENLNGPLLPYMVMRYPVH